MKLGDMDYQKVLQLFRSLNAHGVEYVVVGAIALALHGIVRGTRDVDLFVLPTEDNVQRLRAALHDVWPDPEIQELRAGDLAGDFGVVSYVPPTGDLSIDVIARLGEMFVFADIEWEECDAGEGVRARVATARMLYRMKHDTVRLQDAADAQALREKFGLEDV